MGSEMCIRDRTYSNGIRAAFLLRAKLALQILIALEIRPTTLCSVRIPRTLSLAQALYRSVPVHPIQRGCRTSTAPATTVPTPLPTAPLLLLDGSATPASQEVIASLDTATRALPRFIVLHLHRIPSPALLVRSAWRPHQPLPPAQAATSASTACRARVLRASSALLARRRPLLALMVRSATLCPLLPPPALQATSARTEPPRHALLVPSVVLAAPLRLRVRQGPTRWPAPPLPSHALLAVSA